MDFKVFQNLGKENLPNYLNDVIITLKFKSNRAAWVAQSVKRLTLAQVMISQFVSSSPELGS